jgi:hypothetical protein
MNRKNIFFQGILGIFFLVGLCAATVVAQSTPDPGLLGPHAVLKAEYNLGYTSYIAPPAAMFPVPMEEVGSVIYPSDLTSGPFPVVLFLHGRHETCYDTMTMASSAYWPCTGSDKPIPSYEGYDYLAKNLASNGYIVISISANCINATDGGLGDAGMNARGVLTQHHLDLWNKWNTTGGVPFGTTFVGRLNMQDIGTMGHSRGGEGVVYNALYNKSLGSPYGIKAIFTLAPVDFYRKFVNGIPLLDLSPYCDGDVNDNQGVHFYDDARYADPTDQTPKHTITMMGADHNFFNTIWTPNFVVGGGADDWFYTGGTTDPQCSPGKPRRFDSTRQKAALNAYLPAFFRLYLGHETKFSPILEVRDIIPPVSTTVGDTDVYVSYHPGIGDRLDVNRIDNPTTLTTNTLTGAVTKSGLIGPTECGNTAVGGEVDCSVGSGAQEPHFNGLSEMKIQWSDTFAWYQNQLPVARENLSGYRNLMFRASVNFIKSPSNVDQNFTIQLIDSAGDTSSQVVGNYSHALFFQPGTESGDLPKAEFSTINIPLNTFKGVKMTQIRYIRFRFNKLAAGAITISDLAITNPVCGILSAYYKDSIGKKYYVAFTDTSITNNNDTLTRLWNFGDPSSGVKDTSTLLNPSHTYTAKGTYTACLYLKSKRMYNMVCTDTFCSTIILASSVATEVEDVNTQNDITIIPNPATTYLHIGGAVATDVLTLVNLYGQVVLSVNISDPTIYLPKNLSPGIYYAIVTTNSGRVYQKILITR